MRPIDNRKNRRDALKYLKSSQEKQDKLLDLGQNKAIREDHKDKIFHWVIVISVCAAGFFYFAAASVWLCIG